jgi:hypothetical protein
MKSQEIKTHVVSDTENSMDEFSRLDKGKELMN